MGVSPFALLDEAQTSHLSQHFGRLLDAMFLHEGEVASDGFLGEVVN